MVDPFKSYTTIHTVTQTDAEKISLPIMYPIHEHTFHIEGVKLLFDFGKH